MANECSACCSTILDNVFMDCSNGICKKKYDLKCLKIAPSAFISFSPAYKEKWICPACICLNSKRGSMETFVRADTINFETTSTPTSYINTQNGSHGKFIPTMINADIDSAMLLNEFRLFRSDIVARLDNQATAITCLQNQFAQTKTDLDNIAILITVLEEKILCNFTQDSKKPALTNEVVACTPNTFDEVVSQTTSANNLTVKKLRLNSDEVTNSTVSLPQTSNIITGLPATITETNKGETDDCT